MAKQKVENSTQENVSCSVEKNNICIQFAIEKANYNFIKKFIFAIMGGVFAGLGYIAFNFLNGGYYNSFGEFVKNFSEVGFFFGALIFPVGIMMCIFLGGNLFTSNVLIIMGVISKKVKVKMFALDLIITLIGNIIGGILISLLAFGASIYWTYDPTNGFEINDIGWGVIYIADKKISTEWWSNILSGILCNILVAGSIYAYVKVENKILGTLLVYLFIVVFSICGFQHVVANTYVFTQASLIYTLNPPVVGELFGHLEMGESLYINMLPTTIGNLLGGILISVIYMFIESARIEKGINRKIRVIVPKRERQI